MEPGPLRELPARVVRSAREGKLSTSHAYVDVWRSEQRAAIVVGSSRSGTTKLAELLSAGAGVRLLMEPCHPFRSPLAPRTFTWGEYLAPDAIDEPLHEFWRACLRGSARDPWADTRNTARVAHRRIVKSVAATNLVPWLRAQFPAVPIVYLVRHPLAVATSWCRLLGLRSAPGFFDPSIELGGAIDAMLADPGLLDGPMASCAAVAHQLAGRLTEPFERIVLRWCLENHLPLTAPRPDVYLANYECLFTDPDVELPAIARHLRVPLRRGIAGEVGVRSSTDWNRDGPFAGGPEARIADWAATVDPARRRAALDIVAAFGLDGVYGERPMPLTVVQR